VRTLSFALFLLVVLSTGCDETSERPDAASSSPKTASQGTAIKGDETTAETTKAAAGSARSPRLPTVTIDASSGEEVKVRVEIADNLLGRVIGLRNRESLPENRGMLFVYTEEDQRSFVMDDTVIPLSIAFMDSDGRIIDIQDMEPLADRSYVSAEPAQYALEVNQGFFEEHGVKVGDRAELPG
jgi:uncharacterized protein